MLKVFCAIDIKDGNCVRLTQGDYGRESIYYSDPVKVAKKFTQCGVSNIHIVDLNGALHGKRVNEEVIRSITSETDAFFELGGGIRTIEDVEAALDSGVDRVILGTGAVNDIGFAKRSIDLFGERIAVSLDARNGFLTSDGWTKTLETKAFSYAKELQELGLKTIIYTDVSKDGMLSGPNFEALLELYNNVGINIIASGGISSIDDIKRLNDMGFYGAIVGKALYENKLSMEELREFL